MNMPIAVPTQGVRHDVNPQKTAPFSLVQEARGTRPMSSPPEAAQEAEAEEDEGLVLMRKLRAVNCGDDTLALRDACMMAEDLTQTIFRLKSEREQFESFGYSRGRRRSINVSINAQKIDMRKPRVEAIDIPPVAAQIPDD